MMHEMTTQRYGNREQQHKHVGRNKHHAMLEDYKRRLVISIILSYINLIAGFFSTEADSPVIMASLINQDHIAWF